MKSMLVIVGVPDYATKETVAELLEAQCGNLLTVRGVGEIGVVDASYRFAREAIPLKRKESGRPCGCDPGANWTCEEHRL